ncbi:MAG: formylglycine-generating enzyme family protein [Planctomycetota bacterium]|nr:formylglycine-generating enzyme family protein [Planctomycetota bacterium]
MTFTSRPHPKSFSPTLLTATLLTAALLAFEPVAFGQAENSGEDGLSKELSLDLGQGESIRLVLIPAGKFKMGNHDEPAETVKKVGGGSPRQEVNEEHLANEYPVHEVTISKPFYMGAYELTQAQWKAVMGTEPWKTKAAMAIARAQPRPEGFHDYPAVWMSSYDAIEFCRKLSKKTGMSISLPTEAQWEYACRAGSATNFSFGDGLSKLIDYGWYGGENAGQKEDYAHRVGQLKPNPWGLYDMHGNVWEFCSDWYDKDYYSRSPGVDPENTTETDLRCLRSGSFHSHPTVSRSAQRARWVGPEQVRYNYGIRVVVATNARKKENLKTHFKPIIEKFGQKSTTKIKVESGPEAVQMRNGRVAGKQWIATSGEYRFKLTIEDATGAKLEKLIGRLEKLPESYLSACVAVSDKGEDGIAIYANLGGARAHGGKGYINLVPYADALVIAHEAGHTLEQVATQSDPTILDKWELAIHEDQISVSDYGDKVRHEDLAEFAMVYAVCLDAGPAHLAKLKKLSPKRFELWEKILNPYSPQALRKTLDPFYKQHIVADGLVVAGSEKVSLYALGEAGYLAKKMLANRPDVLKDLLEKRKMFVAVMAYCELQTDLPDCRHMSLWWAYRARGLGSRPVSCGEENLLDLKGDPYKGENIFIHEFAHGIHSVLGEEFNVQLRALFDQAKKSGRFGGYAIDGGVAEFWAEGVQTWFECNGRKRPKSGRGSDSFTVLGPKGELVCHLTTREQLKTYCPEFAKLLDKTFRQNKWVYVPVLQRLDEPHLKGFDPNDAPEFRWPPAVIKAYDRIEAENARKEKERKAKSKR